MHKKLSIVAYNARRSAEKKQLIFKSVSLHVHIENCDVRFMSWSPFSPRRYHNQGGTPIFFTTVIALSGLFGCQHYTWRMTELLPYAVCYSISMFQAASRLPIISTRRAALTLSHYHSSGNLGIKHSPSKGRANKSPCLVEPINRSSSRLAHLDFPLAGN